MCGQDTLLHIIFFLNICVHKWNSKFNFLVKINFLIICWRNLMCGQLTLLHFTLSTIFKKKKYFFKQRFECLVFCCNKLRCGQDTLLYQLILIPCLRYFFNKKFHPVVWPDSLILHEIFQGFVHIIRCVVRSLYYILHF